ncbi:MAG: hypothetical protein IKV85_10130 [Ruminococcus sp.]|nr:hypothetical protein [Ruminococcus sp.]
MVTDENYEIRDILPEQDTTEYLQKEEQRAGREGKSEDIPAFQGILCIILAVGMIMLNLRQPDMTEELYYMIKTFSSSEQELFENPLYYIGGFIENLCRK